MRNLKMRKDSMKVDDIEINDGFDKDQYKIEPVAEIVNDVLNVLEGKELADVRDALAFIMQRMEDEVGG